MKVDGASADEFKGAVGIMGQFGTGKMLARDGKTIVVDPNQFGLEWQVQPSESNLFHASRSPQLSNGERCIMPSVEEAQSRGRRLGETKTRAEAEAACEWWGPGAKERCVIDVILTGDLEIAEVGP